jgi:uncharacterized membrane protein YeaQ/YmgE (transglycosylase-associated protein family)
MNTAQNHVSQFRRIVPIITLGFSLLAAQGASAAEEKPLSEKAQQLTEEAKVKIEDAGSAVSDTFSGWWKKLGSARLKNRTRDEIVAWVIMGVLVGAVAGVLTSLKATGAGKAGRILLGLAGAIIGGIIVRMRDFDFGWGPVLIRYEELFFSFVGAVVLVVIGRFWKSKSKKQPQ